MPELTSEHPTNEELKQYLDEHWQEVSHLLDYFREEFEFDCRQTFQLFYEAVLKSLIRLNEFPRENAFWRNTNKKPTIYKLHEFCELIYKEKPNDVLVLWTKIALAMKQGSVESEFGRIVEKLVGFGELKVETIIDIELFECLMYDGNEVYFAGELRKLNLVDEARLKLEDLQKSSDKTVAKWAENVLKEVENQ